MNRTDIAYLINTTPKYFYLLPLHLTLLQRYAPNLQWPVYLATEEPNHPGIQLLQMNFPFLQTLPLTQEQEGFIESRAVATDALPSSIRYVFPIQEDFLLEGRPVEDILEHALEILDTQDEVMSLRLMPCPGPKGNLKYRDTKWIVLDEKTDEYLFVYQATLWRREAYSKFMNFFTDLLNSKPLTAQQKNKIAIHDNVCEVEIGKRVLTDLGGTHLAYPRAGPWPNAVYLSAWPYRPTAVVKGHLESWAVELGDRERVSVVTGPSLR